MIVYHEATDIIKNPDVFHSKLWIKFLFLKKLEEVYKQNLENDIINAISKIKKIELRKAFDVYYSSKLAEQIEKGEYGIENLDAKYLAEDLIENELKLFE